MLLEIATGKAFQSWQKNVTAIIMSAYSGFNQK